MSDPVKQFECLHPVTFKVYLCSNEGCGDIHIDQCVDDKVYGSILVPRSVAPKISEMLLQILEDEPKEDKLQ